MSICHSSRLSDLAIEIPGGVCSFIWKCEMSDCFVMQISFRQSFEVYLVKRYVE